MSNVVDVVKKLSFPPKRRARHRHSSRHSMRAALLLTATMVPTGRTYWVAQQCRSGELTYLKSQPGHRHSGPHRQTRGRHSRSNDSETDTDTEADTRQTNRSLPSRPAHHSGRHGRKSSPTYWIPTGPTTNQLNLGFLPRAVTVSCTLR